MDDCNGERRVLGPCLGFRVQIPLWTIVTASAQAITLSAICVQIPLWTIVTHKPASKMTASSSFRFPLWTIVTVLRGDFSGFDEVFRFLYGRL